ncbi:hypothetical protein DFP72DRAFT_848110 [Ephemerocybe angulata]|uniref:Uncharacterized protein n=1 Tax=Ephemerocybe angulata TaxID=980116 RepID=A0A8H6HWX4_9AGAR|nr:hypothetical protein DFP72DRAFT_848110 [Tulosesus angulatus]
MFRPGRSLIAYRFNGEWEANKPKWRAEAVCRALFGPDPNDLANDNHDLRAGAETIAKTRTGVRKSEEHVKTTWRASSPENHVCFSLYISLLNYVIMIENISRTLGCSASGISLPTLLEAYSLPWVSSQKTGMIAH